VSVVVDASILAKWFVEEEGSDDARKLQRRALFAPDLVIVETANVLWKKVRQGSFDAAFVPRAIAVLQQADLTLTESLTLASRAVEVAIMLDHAVYDCFYLSLAELRGVPFVSADDRLARKLLTKPAAASAEVIPLARFGDTP